MTKQIELLLADYFNTRQNIIVPNVEWGLGLHECDVLILTKSNYAWEVEIKVSLADLKADLKKWHKHNHVKIRRLYFALPEHLLAQGEEHIPTHAGILAVCADKYYGRLKIEKRREAVNRPGAVKIRPDEREHLYHLCNMRMWNAKRALMARGVHSIGA